MTKPMKNRFLLLMLTLLVAGTVAASDDLRTLVERALKSYANKEYAASADQFAAAIAAGADDSGTLYNAACASALAGRSDAALELLTRAVDAGFLNVDHISRDTDLTSLHSSPRWAGIIAYAGKAKAKQERMWSSPAISSSFSETIPLDARIAGLSRIWSEAKYNFIHFDNVPDLDWDALYVSYLPRVRETESTVEYYQLLMSFMAQLKDGHTAIIPPREIWARLWSEPAVTVADVEGRLIVTRVADPALHGIEPGMELVAVDGLPVRQYAQQNIAPYISASTPQDLAARIARRILWGPKGSTASLTLIDSRGRTVQQDVPRANDDDLAKLAPAAEPMEYRLLPGNVAYVALNEFGDSKAAQAFEARFDEIAKADALILDVRRNGGGDSGVGYRVLSTLVDKPFLTSQWSTREYRPTYRAWGRGELTYREPSDEVPPSGKRLFSKPVVVLTSPSTYSAAEDFVVAFDAAKRGVIIGEPTGGSTGQPLVFDLPGGGKGRVCTKHDSYPDGREFIGVGIQPQFVVKPTVSDVRMGKDTVLDAAVKYLTRGR